MYKTCQQYNINSKNLLCWAKQEKEIKRSKGGRRYNYSLQLASILIFGMFVFYRRVGFDWSAKFLELEEKLHSEFWELCRKGIKVKGWWFKARAKEIFILITPSNTHKDGSPDSKSDTNSALEEALTQHKLHLVIKRLPSKSSISRYETFNFLKKEMVLRKKDLTSAKFLTSIKLHSHFLLLMAQRMKQQMLQQSGFVVEGLDSRNDNALYSLPSLLTEYRELNHS